MPRLPNTLFAAALFACLPLAAQAQGQAPAQAQTPALPDDGTQGKLLAENLCTMCHRTNLITGSSGYTQDGWKALMGTMLDLSGAPVETATHHRISRQALPAQHRRTPKLVPGPNEIAFTEWVMPTTRPAHARPDAGRRRHDLVGRAVRQPDRALRSQDRREAGISAAGKCRGRTPSNSITRAGPGTPATRTAPSAGSIPTPARSPSTRCRIRPRRIRTR